MSREGTGRYLRHLLTEEGPLRQRWVKHDLQRAGQHLADVNIAAVARVITLHLWDTGERPESHQTLPRSIRDKIRRALDGSTLTSETLEWFIAAFEIPEVEARRLRALLSGGPSVRVLEGTAGDLSLPRPRKHRTLSLHEHHIVGRDRSPERHTTTQVLEAVEDGLTSYLYLFDTSALTVDVLAGGTTTGTVRRYGDGVFGLEVVLSRPLLLGETTSLVYTTTFHYDTPPPPCFRRAAFTRIEHVDLRVEFHPTNVPRAIFLAEWPGLDEPASSRTRRQLEPDRSTHVFLRSIENVIVGFEWEW